MENQYQEPHQERPTMNKVQGVVVAALICILAAILVGYIMIGMKAAKNAPITEPVSTETEQDTTATESERSQQIFEALQTSSETEVSAERQQEIWEALQE